MGDSLDDFFAKKDKSKKKTKASSKSKFVAADLLPTNPDEGTSEINEQLGDLKVVDDQQPEIPKEKKKSKKKKEKDGGDESRRNEDDEWNTVEEEKDYSGLRITTKSIVKEAEVDVNDAGDDSDPEYDENGQLKPKQAEQTGVWSKVSSSGNEQESSTQSASPPQTPTPVVQEMPNVTGGRYIPPSKRAGASQRSADGELLPVSVKRPTRKKEAPNITSVEDFPTLGAAPPPSDFDASSFERVKSGASNQQNQSRSAAAPQQLETTNMYSLLQQKR